MDSSILVNISAQRFDRLRAQGAFYIDKTEFIREWWEKSSDVTLITRPRRFGKTLNISMLECFFSTKYAGRGDLFEGLSIWEGRYRELQGTFPVLFLTFANIKASRYADMEYKISKVFSDLYEQHRYLLDGELLSRNEREYYEHVKPGMAMQGAADAIHSLTGFMQRYYKRDVIILLDEYDTPMQEAWLNGYWDKAAEFFREFFNSTFKTNPYLDRAMITGITRISKESIFSDLNNLDVITTTSDEYATAFGFTEDEVFQALDAVGLEAEKQGVKQWYDGFTFGSYTDIYNPWSIASFIRKKGRYEAYWTNTSGNALVNALVQNGDAAIKQTMEELLQGKSFVTELDEQVVFNQLGSDNNAVWSLLLAAGYLKVLKTEAESDDEAAEDNVFYTLTLTNHEVRQMFRKMVKGWFQGGTTAVYNEFIKAMLNDNVFRMNTFMNKVALNTFSSFDSGNKPSEEAEPERFYHGFVLGMVVNLADTYKVCSNRESGYGRYDVILKPLDKSKKAFIFEFKVLSPYEGERTLEETLANAHAQIEEKQYAVELLSEGFAAEQIRKYGFAFQGKKCLIG
ncbi:MAG: ATP-binding protein [Lachnospiraceae bacterium]|nr:ATP-binding protein [Lachnospiraceae bacterium]